ncbi:hypothetical protein [Caudoviricetes sp.]|nr:hypothetical protein [Caudoviricetes sp.]
MNEATQAGVALLLQEYLETTTRKLHVTNGYCAMLVP